jgi:hypothetical protein
MRAQSLKMILQHIAKVTEVSIKIANPESGLPANSGIPR